MTQPNTTTTTAGAERAARFQTYMTAAACERLAAHLEAVARRLATNQGARFNMAQVACLEEAAGELAHHADALREASGHAAAVAANVAALTTDPTIR